MMTEHNMIAPGSTIGILGGGQLGRMLALAAAQLGMRTHIFCPDPQSPAFEVTPHHTIAAYDDEKALKAFASAVDIITYEFENVPVETARILEKLKTLAPASRPLAIAQDRIAEKQFLAKNAIDIAPFEAVETEVEFTSALQKIGKPSVLKTVRLGYDGKGQRIIRTPADAAKAFADLGGQPLVLEAFIPFDKEVSVIVARNADGQIRDYDAAENVHENHILKTSTVPAQLDRLTIRKISRIAQQIAGALDYVGVLAVEFFIVPDTPHPKVLVNEIAPRVHNSGHWTQSVCVTNQFEQHIRAICNWPLGNPNRLADVIMENLLGDEINSVATDLESGAQPHVYGKSEARPGRKMGHINKVNMGGDTN